MKILVTGASGMVGSDLCPTLQARGHEVIRTDVHPGACTSYQLDVRQREAIATILRQTGPELVIHLAAETDVDRCEQEPAHAYETNAVGTEYIASCCQQAGVRMLYVSTAGVFDGTKAAPYVESDAPNPVNVYGRAKLAGEFAVRQLPGFRIVRAGWMVGGCEHDKKFAGKILRLLEHRRQLSVVTDKIGSPTFTIDLSAGIAALIETEATGIFHMTNHGVCSRYEFACQMLKELRLEGVTITPIGSEAFPLPAPRAASEAMASERLASLGLSMPAWQESLKAYLHQFRFVKLVGAKTPGP